LTTSHNTTFDFKISLQAGTLSTKSANFLLNFNEDLTSVNDFIRLSRGVYSESSEESDWVSAVEIPELLESVSIFAIHGHEETCLPADLL
jgi:hypothetical protein